MDVCLLWVLFVVRLRSLRRADHSSRSSREVLPNVVRRCVWYRNLVNEEAVAYRGLSPQIQTFPKFRKGKIRTDTQNTELWNKFKELGMRH
jgi:hypothetical protein